MMKRNYSSDEEDRASDEAAMNTQPKQREEKRSKITSNGESGAVQTDWNSMWERIAQFKEEHGHMPQQEEDRELSSWISQQQELKKEGRLGTEEIERLNQIGFDWQPRNPRHLQWETRFTQLQKFKAKYGHAQVPIGWPDNVQLANWVSKQRQEYKNLLRGRTTRLDENRIRLLNSVGFAWQLQRGGRRRQLKARDKKSQSSQQHPGDGNSTASEGTGSKAKGEAADNDVDEEPCILPGEVLIGQGAPMPMSPQGRSSESGQHGKIGVGQNCQNGSAKVSQQELAASRLNHQSLQQPLQQSLQQRPSLLPPSQPPMGMQFLNRPSTNGGPSQTGLAVPNNDLLDYVLARNALMQNLQGPQAAAAPSASLQMLRGGVGNYPHLGFPSGSATTGHSHLLSTTSAQRNILPASSLFPLTATASSLTGGSTAGSAGGTGNSWRAATAAGTPSSSSAPWSSSITTSLLDAAPLGGARIASGINPTANESKLTDSASNRALHNSLQLQQLQQQYQAGLGLPSASRSSPQSLGAGSDFHSGHPAVSSTGEQQQPQGGAKQHYQLPPN